MTLASIATLVFMTALLPLGLGVAVHSFAPAFAERFAKPISLIGVLALGIAVAIAVDNHPEQKLTMAAVLLYLLVNIVVSLAYHLWSKRRKPEA